MIEFYQYIFNKLTLTQKEKDYLFDGYVTGCLDIANKLKDIVGESMELAKILTHEPRDITGNTISDTPPIK